MLKTTGSKVLVEFVSVESKHPLGIILPDSKEKPTQGVAAAVGPKVLEVKEGDHVLFGKFSGVPLEYEGKKYYAVEEKEIVAVLEL